MTVFVDAQMQMLIDMLSQHVNVVPFEGRASDAASLAALRSKLLQSNADAIVVRSITKVNEALLHGTSVRMVATATAGIDHVDVQYLADHGIVFRSAAGSNANAVADYVMLAIEYWMDEYWNDDHCQQPSGEARQQSGKGLGGCTIGIVGYGNVGKRLAVHAHAEGMRVVVLDPLVRELTTCSEFDVADDLSGLIAVSDIVSLHVPLTHVGEHATLDMIGAKEVAQLRINTLFINTSRGGIVDEHALKQRMETKEVQAVFDVYDNEPAIDVSVLQDALVATPHVAGYTLESRQNAAKSIYDALLRWMEISSVANYMGFTRTHTNTRTIRDLAADTSHTRSAFNYRGLHNNLSVEEVFDNLRKTYVLRNELYTDPM